MLILVIVFVYVVFSSLFPVKYSEYVEKYSVRYNVEKNLIYGIIKAESGFDETAVSNKDAVGLMQIKEDTAKWCIDQMGEEIDIKNLSNPEINIKIGVWYFSYLKEQLKSDELAIVAYNAGITHVKEWLKDGLIDEKVSDPDKIPFKETKKYIKNVRIYKKVYSIMNNIRLTGILTK